LHVSPIIINSLRALEVAHKIFPDWKWIAARGCFLSHFFSLTLAKLKTNFFWATFICFLKTQDLKQMRHYKNNPSTKTNQFSDTSNIGLWWLFKWEWCRAHTCLNLCIFFVGWGKDLLLWNFSFSFHQSFIPRNYVFLKKSQMLSLVTHLC
jgi:hypothetical protein